MSTRSAIIRQAEDGTFEGIYCHYDGYPSGVGAFLEKHYKDPEKVKALIALGDISYLEETVAPSKPHSFDNPQPGVVVAYGRDRGEEGVGTKTGKTVDEVEEQIGHNGYVYVFSKGKWKCNGKSIKAAIKAEKTDY